MGNVCVTQAWGPAWILNTSVTIRVQQQAAHLKLCCGCGEDGGGQRQADFWKSLDSLLNLWSQLPCLKREGVVQERQQCQPLTSKQINTYVYHVHTQLITNIPTQRSLM